VEFIETADFTRYVTELLTDYEYRQLQAALVRAPKQGVVIPGTPGLRKLRWRIGARGKRGGLRVIYYCAGSDQIYLLLAYDKARQHDLIRGQLDALSAFVRGGVL
jgi:mRNA-degrading endonuclease RelE of RelBE toxin-antitoxin system